MDPLWFAATVRQLVDDCARAYADGPVAGVGVTGMAETIFVDTADGRCLPGARVERQTSVRLGCPTTTSPPARGSSTPRAPQQFDYAPQLEPACPSGRGPVCRSAPYRCLAGVSSLSAHWQRARAWSMFVRGQ